MDCCQFVRDCIKHKTGRDYGAEFEYSDEDGANKIIADHGGLAGLFSYIFGDPCDDGDVVVCEQVDGSEVAGIVYKDRIIVRSPKGVTDWPTSYAKHSWKVS